MEIFTLLGMMFIMIVVQEIIYGFCYLIGKEDWKEDVRMVNTCLAVLYGTLLLAHAFKL